MATIEIDLPAEKIHELLSSSDGMGFLLKEVLQQMLEAEMTEHLRAAPGERTDRRRGYRNGSYERKLTTRVGTIELEVPRDRDGTFQTALFERYQRSEKALVLAMMEMVVQGVSTRKVKKITTELCGRRFTKSTVSRLTQGLDEQVQAWAERPLTAQDYPFLLVDGFQVKVRRQAAVRPTTVLVAVGITEEGRREILGLTLAYGESTESWRSFFEHLKARGLSAVEVLTSDACEGAKQAAYECFGDVIWQRCQAHFARNVLDKTPRALREKMQGALEDILRASLPEAAREAFLRITDELSGQADRALRCLEEGFEDATAVLALPAKYRRRLRTTNMVERLIEEIRRREKVVRIFPNEQSVWRLVGALLAEQHDEWSTGRRYLNMDEYHAWSAALDQAPPLPKAA
jgi:transposase-like protein